MGIFKEFNDWEQGSSSSIQKGDSDRKSDSYYDKTPDQIPNVTVVVSTKKKKCQNMSPKDSKLSNSKNAFKSDFALNKVSIINLDIIYLLYSYSYI